MMKFCALVQEREARSQTQFWPLMAVTVMPAGGFSVTVIWP